MHIHELKFYIDKDAPSEYMNRWTDLKTKCVNGYIRMFNKKY